ncbi:MAG: outer membrane protein assembly factor BamA [Gammaproteobacteria bacterium]|jgi:outer membrane protein insertion porin family
MNLIYKNIFIYLLIGILSNVHAIEEFTIEDIQVSGVQRLTPGTVFNYLPVKIGDVFNDERSSESLRGLFRTGFFDDVVLEREGNILLITVVERATIGSLEIDGNKDITTVNLMEGLEEAGFVEGQVYDKSQLEKLQTELERQYFANGKYGVRISSEVETLPNNRVAVSVNISEGDAAGIKQINVVGNQDFTQKELLEDFELAASSWRTLLSKGDRYSRQKLGGDIETLQSFYQDKGYINFDLESTQVTITPDKKDIYVTLNVNEGEQYTVSEVKLSGDLIVDEEYLFRLISVYQGELFSRKQMTDSSTRLTNRVGAEGYAFANVNAVPELDDENNTVAITFFIDPGKRIYVRRVNFTGNIRTRDDVLRREMRQQEGGWISTPQVERGKIRLQRLGYFGEVNTETPAVPGSADQVDVEYTVEERPFGTFTAGLGYSQLDGLIVSTSISQNNLFGSGNRASFAFNNSSFQRTFSVGYQNPYFTDDGISRGYSVNYSETSGRQANLTAFDSRVFGGSVNFSFPISEYNSINTSLGYENTRLSEDGFFSRQVGDFIRSKGNKFDILRASVGFAYDTRNRTIFPDNGMFLTVVGEVSLPTIGNSLEFYKLSYRGQWFKPIGRGFTFALKADMGYGDGFLGNDQLPFFENYYGGGPRSVRGYRENTLGPLDDFLQPLGGNVKIITGAEVIIPIPFLEQFDQFQFSAFVDAGNVYCSGGGIVRDVNNNITFGRKVIADPIPFCREANRFDLAKLRGSTGLGAVWISPLGVMSFSLSTPINNEPGDQTEKFQFNIGTNF